MKKCCHLILLVPIGGGGPFRFRGRRVTIVRCPKCKEYRFKPRKKP